MIKACVQGSQSSQLDFTSGGNIPSRSQAAQIAYVSVLYGGITVARLPPAEKLKND